MGLIMITVKHDRNFKVTKYSKGYSVDFSNRPYAWFDTLQEAIDRYDTDRMNWYSDVQ